MINSEFRKKMADSWFSYLQNQICKEFENIEKIKKISKRDWNKEKKRRWWNIFYIIWMEIYLIKLV